MFKEPYFKISTDWIVTLKIVLVYLSCDKITFLLAALGRNILHLGCVRGDQ